MPFLKSLVYGITIDHRISVIFNSNIEVELYPNPLARS